MASLPAPGSFRITQQLISYFYFSGHTKCEVNLLLLRVVKVQTNTCSHMPGKHILPTKICLTCSRPFSWRKKWKIVWDEVKYCSERCRRNKA